MRIFADSNPIAASLFFLAVSGIAMFSANPIISAISLLGAVVLFLVNNGNGQGYTFEALKAEDFKITQSEAQKAKNTCDMRVSDAPFAMYDIENCDELKAYIKANFN